MLTPEIPETQWAQLSGLIADRMGLHYPRERWADLQRGIAGAAREFGFQDAAACMGALLSRPPTQAQLQVLASQLTIGETYFFRDWKTLEALAGDILPELIRARRGREQRLRIWSAGCCSGEEPYSLAILLHELLHDLRDWKVTILATDINPRFLAKAEAGIYGEWSFRNAPAGLKARYFKRTTNGCYAIAPRVRNLVNFANLNLVQDASEWTSGIGEMDIILCRNVLMYFTPSQTRAVIGNLHHALAEGGWLVVSPSEASQVLFPQFVAVNFPGAILYRKSDVPAAATPAWAGAPLCEAVQTAAIEAEVVSPPAPLVAAVPLEPTPAVPPKANASVDEPLAAGAEAQRLFRQGRYAQAVETLSASSAEHAPGPEVSSLMARALANLGRLAEALAWCDRWIAADKLNPAGHYLHAVVMLERGDTEQARASLQRAIYLHPEFVLAYFALGSVARSLGKPAEADRHFANALHLLRRLVPHELLPESEGLTAARLTETIVSMVEVATQP